MATFNNAKNQLDGYSYDADGNLLSDGIHSYTYDAESRIIAVDGGGTATYVYDAEGRRVQKTTASGTVNYVYDIAGEQVAEVNSSGGANRLEAYAGGKHIATYANGVIYFDHADWLGTERMRTTASGSSCETIVSLAFGDGTATTGSCSDASPMHFTGKQHDAESNLDDFDARYYSSQWGRFTVSDPVVITPERFYDPQQFNEYAYVRDNPLRLVDPTGAILELAGNVEEAFSDLQQIAGADAWRIDYHKDPNDDRYTVTFNNDDGGWQDGGEGIKLIHDLVVSARVYVFSIGATVQTAQGLLRVDYLVNLDNLQSHPGKKDAYTPPDGVDDLLAIDSRPKHTSYTKLLPAPEYTVVFHELAEAYAKVDHNKKYEAAHQEAVDRETVLRKQRSYLKAYNPGSGPGDTYKRTQTEKIIKRD